MIQRGAARMTYLHAIHLKSLDVRKAAAWYSEMLGAKILGEKETECGLLNIYINLHGINLVITQHPDADSMPRAPLEPHIGIEHFGLVFDELDPILEKLSDAGVEILVLPEEGLDGPNHVPSRWAFIRAPDDVRLELGEMLTKDAKSVRW
jgi:extradiol dioxygenase family protein